MDRPSLHRHRPRALAALLLVAASTTAVGVMASGCDRLFSANSSPANVPAAKPPAPTPPARIVALGRVEPEGKILQLGSDTFGLITRVNFDTGDEVEENAVLVEVSRKAEEKALEAAKAALRSAEAQLDVAKKAFAASKPKVLQAQQELDRVKALVAHNDASTQDLEAAIANSDSWNLERTRLESAAAAQERIVQEMQAKVDVAAFDVERKVVRAPVAGRLLAMNVTLGDVLAERERRVIAELAPAGPVHVVAEIDELFAAEVQVGLGAICRAPATGKTLANGQVSFIAPSLRKKSLFSESKSDLEDRRVREIRVKLDPNVDLLIGTRVEVLIDLGPAAEPAPNVPNTPDAPDARAGR